MGGNEQQSQPRVIIPETGAAKYWYVDPRAGTPSPYSRDKQPDLLDALRRLLGTQEYQQYQPQADQGSYQF